MCSTLLQDSQSTDPLIAQWFCFESVFTELDFLSHLDDEHSREETVSLSLTLVKAKTTALQFSVNIWT